MTYALHQAAIAGDDIGAVVHQCLTELGREQPLGKRHADAIGKTLAERSGRRLDTGRGAVFGVARGAAA